MKFEKKQPVIVEITKRELLEARIRRIEDYLARCEVVLKQGTETKAVAERAEQYRTKLAALRQELEALNE